MNVDEMSDQSMLQLQQLLQSTCDNFVFKVSSPIFKTNPLLELFRNQSKRFSDLS